MIGWLRIAIGLVVVAVLTPVLLVWQMIAWALRLDEAVAPRLWHRTILWALGIRVHRVGEMARERPLLIASNHVSWTDIMVLGSVADVHFIAKAEMASWPVIGYLARWQRTIFVERERKGRSGVQADEIGKRLSQGHAVVLFPEGTTHDGNRIEPFKSTLFGSATLAIASGAAEHVYIQPVAIAYTRLHGMPMGRYHRRHASWIGDLSLVPHVKTLLQEGAIDVEVHFGEPVEFARGGNRKAVAVEAEARVRKMLVAALSRPEKS